MKWRKQGQQQKKPISPGWYRVVSRFGEELRYFDGTSWTNTRKSVPFWMEGPEWAEAASLVVSVDSDDPDRVPRAPSRPQGGTQVFLRNLRPNSRRGRSKRRAWLLLALIFALSISSYALSSTQGGLRMFGATPMVPTIANPGLIHTINAVCLASNLGHLEPLGEIVSQQLRHSTSLRRNLANAYSTTLANVSAKMQSLAPAPGDQDSLAAWQNLWNRAAIDASLVAGSARNGAGLSTGVQLLQRDLLNIKSFSVTNSIESCSNFIT